MSASLKSDASGRESLFLIIGIFGCVELQIESTLPLQRIIIFQKYRSLIPLTPSPAEIVVRSYRLFWMKFNSERH